ncbi:sulfotransferase 1E1-like [Ptychodera flava]|uniref:sulfotransferase 1E1-like n=1 Tax=Ptychodera flava TaxID=63121 RepID=UPI003969E6E0
MAKPSGFIYNKHFFTDAFYNKQLFESQAIDEWDIRPDDIVVVTYPKSGTYWMLKAVSSLQTDLNLILPQSERSVRIDMLYEDETRLSGSYAERVKAVKKFFHEMPSPRLLYFHLPPQFFPRKWIKGEKKCKVICVSRNPKDVCVSEYLFQKALTGHGIDLTWDE